MKILKSEVLNTTEKIDVFNIWNRAYPSQIAHKSMEDFEKYLSSCKNPTHLLLKNDSQVIGWLCVFDRNSERWFALIVDPIKFAGPGTLSFGPSVRAFGSA